VSEARDAVLGRIRAALADAPVVPDVPRDYAQHGTGARDDVVGRFVRQVEELGGTVVEGRPDVRFTIAAVLAGRGATRVVVAPDLPGALRPEGVELVEDRGLTSWELDALDGALTTCAAACADTGTIALDGGAGQGRRAITLVPDLHVCVVARDQVVETVPELFARLASSARAGRPIVLVSGPSATSDLGFERVEGVHGPRRFVVVLAP
jgi:L-lactate dehydrogenase complex protein LldG